jgi:hypothetical protein
VEGAVRVVVAERLIVAALSGDVPGRVPCRRVPVAPAPPIVVLPVEVGDDASFTAPVADDREEPTGMDRPSASPLLTPLPP